ncbi:hypothetical protein FGCSD_0072 [Streptococcus dysgalactiae]|nr:hypothetical protein FGCSD_0072 [Streptococcus dysgalactiae]
MTWISLIYLVGIRKEDCSQLVDNSSLKIELVHKLLNFIFDGFNFNTKAFILANHVFDFIVGMKYS